MIKLDGEILILDHTQNGDDILPLLARDKGKEVNWYIDIGIEDRKVLHWLIDAEILGDPIAIRYVAANGQTADATVVVEELISGPDGDMCRLRGQGTPPAAMLEDDPKQM